MIAVGAYPTRTDAELAQTVLTAAGIPSEIEADDAGGAYPFDLTGAARLVVDDGPFARLPWHEATKRRRGIRARWSPQTLAVRAKRLQR